MTSQIKILLLNYLNLKNNDDQFKNEINRIIKNKEVIDNISLNNLNKENEGKNSRLRDYFRW